MSPFDIDGARGPGGRSLVTGSVGGGGGPSIDADVLYDAENGTLATPASNWDDWPSTGCNVVSNPSLKGDNSLERNSNSLNVTIFRNSNEQVDKVQILWQTPAANNYVFRVTDKSNSNFIDVLMPRSGGGFDKASGTYSVDTTYVSTITSLPYSSAGHHVKTVKWSDGTVIHDDDIDDGGKTLPNNAGGFNVEVPGNKMFLEVFWGTDGSL